MKLYLNVTLAIS